MTQSNNPPADTIRYGGLKAVIWKNSSKDDPQNFRYSVNYIRSYKDSNGEWQDTTSLSEIDNLKMNYLVSKATARIVELKSVDRDAEADEQETEEAA
ncbi:MAG: hypothetical protein AAGA30_00185 [Planctomycetota bacterium]